jgi:hypothetical protein
MNNHSIWSWFAGWTLLIVVFLVLVTVKKWRRRHRGTGGIPIAIGSVIIPAVIMLGRSIIFFAGFWLGRVVAYQWWPNGWSHWVATVLFSLLLIALAAKLLGDSEKYEIDPTQAPNPELSQYNVLDIIADVTGAIAGFAIIQAVAKHGLAPPVDLVNKIVKDGFF